MPGAKRDPVSESFDEPAARLLNRAYRSPGAWAGTYVRNPGPAWIVWGARHRVNLLGADSAPGGQARTRWARGFVRSCYWLHKHHYWPGRGLVLTEQRASTWPGPLEYRVGRVKIDTQGLVVGRLVQVRILPGGPEARREVDRLPDSRRIYTGDGAPGGRFADPADRDW
jgi:hypothetical protein